MLNKDQNVKVSDATKDDSSDPAGSKKDKTNCYKPHRIK